MSLSSSEESDGEGRSTVSRPGGLSSQDAVGLDDEEDSTFCESVML